MLLTIDLAAIAEIRHMHGFTAPSPANYHEKLLMAVGEITEAQNEIRGHHTFHDVYPKLVTGFWCKAHHRIFCHDDDCLNHPVARVNDHDTTAQEIPNGKWERYELTSPQGFGIELADAIMRLADIAYAMNINLQECIDAKMDFNRQRPIGHGRAF